MRSLERPAFKPAQVSLLEAAVALLARMDDVMQPHIIHSSFYGEVDVLRQAIQREKAK